MEDWLRESLVSPIFEDSYSADCHACNISANISGTQTPCPVHNFDIGWCPDGCEPIADPDALPDHNNFPCEHIVDARDGEAAIDAIVVAAYKFDLVQGHAVCADFQVLEVRRVSPLRVVCWLTDIHFCEPQSYGFSQITLAVAVILCLCLQS